MLTVFVQNFALVLRFLRVTFQNYALIVGLSFIVPPAFVKKFLPKFLLVMVFRFIVPPGFLKIIPLNLDQMLKVYQVLLYVFLALCRPRSTRRGREGW